MTMNMEEVNSFKNIKYFLYIYLLFGIIIIYQKLTHKSPMSHDSSLLSGELGKWHSATFMNDTSL